MNFIFNYIIKIDAHKIKYQLKNRHLFETIILKKKISIMQSISQPIQYYMIKLKKLKKLKDEKTKKKTYRIDG
jgi:hypothetical protein